MQNDTPEGGPMWSILSSCMASCRCYTHDWQRNRVNTKTPCSHQLQSLPISLCSSMPCARPVGATALLVHNIEVSNDTSLYSTLAA